MEGRLVVLRDNGLRSFVPPSFSWDVLEPETGDKIATVSEVDLSALGLTAEEENEMRYAMMRGEYRVRGCMKETRTFTPSGQKGVVFIVESAERVPRQLGPLELG